MGEAAGGLGEGHPGYHPLPDRVWRGGGAGIQPGERVGGRREGAEQRPQVVGRPCAGGAGPGRAVGIGFVRGGFPGRTQQVVRRVGVGGAALGGHGGVSPSG
jgi:hypothetical protein